MEAGDGRDDEPDPAARRRAEDADAPTAPYCVKDTVGDADKAEGVCGAHAEGEQVKQIGNSVPVRTAKAIVKAIFGKAV